MSENKFPVEKTLDLGFLGKDWNGASLVLSGLTFAQTRELSASVKTDSKGNPESKDNSPENIEFIVTFLKDHFLRGKAWNGTELVDLTADDIVDLPVEVINKAIKLLSGQPDPKS